MYTINSTPEEPSHDIIIASPEKWQIELTLHNVGPSMCPL